MGKLNFLSDGHWRYSRPARADDPEQGWKLHVSATVQSAAEVFAKVYPALRRRDALFKIPATDEFLISLNSGLTVYSQVGKFLTVYPRSTAEAVELAAELHRLTSGLAGPKVPFDIRYRSSSLVHYRYGSFRAAPGKPRGFVRGADGRLRRDRRAPGRAVPSWLNDPFRASARKPRRKRRGPLGVDYFVYRAKTLRGKGGVFEAIDLTVSPARYVIIKEGRRHGETDGAGLDGLARVRQEGRVLRALHRAGLPVPKVLREFSQNGNRYLVLERLPGRPLVSARRDHPAQTSWRRAAKILDRLEPLLQKLHARGWVWRDVKPSHVFAQGGQYFLLDFENACRRDEQSMDAWSSRNYRPPEFAQRTHRPPGTREDDYSLGVIAFQFLAGQFPALRLRERMKVYRRTRCPDSLRVRIEALLAL